MTTTKPVVRLPKINTGIMFAILRLLKSNIEVSIDPASRATVIVNATHIKVNAAKIKICINSDLFFITASRFLSYVYII